MERRTTSGHRGAPGSGPVGGIGRVARRTLLAVGAGLGMALLAGRTSRSPSSGTPQYEVVEIDDGPVYASGLADETTDFDGQFLAVVQVAPLNSSMRLRVVDTVLSAASFTVVLDLVDEPPYTDDRVITTLAFRVRQRGSGPPDGIAVELSTGDGHGTFSGD